MKTIESIEMQSAILLLVVIGVLLLLSYLLSVYLARRSLRKIEEDMRTRSGMNLLHTLGGQPGEDVREFEKRIFSGAAGPAGGPGHSIIGFDTNSGAPITVSDHRIVHDPLLNHMPVEVDLSEVHQRMQDAHEKNAAKFFNVGDTHRQAYGDSYKTEPTKRKQDTPTTERRNSVPDDTINTAVVAAVIVSSDSGSSGPSGCD